MEYEHQNRAEVVTVKFLLEFIAHTNPNHFCRFDQKLKILWMATLGVMIVKGILLAAFLVVDFQTSINHIQVKTFNFDRQVFAEEMTDEEQTKKCLFLNSVRSNFTACCAYPALVMWRWQMDICQEHCRSNAENGNEVDVQCCIKVCAFGLLQVLTSDTEFSPVKPSGLIHSFMLSVGNDTKWEPVITNSVNRSIFWHWIRLWVQLHTKSRLHNHWLHLYRKFLEMPQLESSEFRGMRFYCSVCFLMCWNMKNKYFEEEK